MSTTSNQYNEQTKRVAEIAAQDITNLLSGYNVQTNEQFQDRLTKILANMLIDFRQGVLNDRINQELGIHIDVYHQESKNE